MARIRSNAKLLIEAKFGPKKSVRDVASELPYRLESVQKLYNDTMERYPRNLLTKMCTYLECGIHELLILEDVNGEDDEDGEPQE
ncbi:helix-turn-helix domain-containing protein [Paenibacillus agilis]|uniref:XRE family transcriptional regulator n=1 Tax=Paenibacillus agilis TaxID=3020863 RepID=A0A559IX83_9BACL|nr:helix-turn-helix transcriptional regulator [Paenibacillus agilis]TVX92240.1 XRE family transcriptional regulator [Paenibacillus agilis]